MRPTCLCLPVMLLACGGGADADSNSAPGTGATTGSPSTSTTFSYHTDSGSTTSTGTPGGATSGTTFALGPNDATARIGCDLLGTVHSPLVAVDNQGDAGQVVITPSSVQAWDVELPATGQGFLSVEVGEWNTTQAIFTYVDNDYGYWVLDGDHPGSRMLNGACPGSGITDQRILLDHWTPVTIRFEDTGPRTAFLAVVRQ